VQCAGDALQVGLQREAALLACQAASHDTMQQQLHELLRSLQDLARACGRVANTDGAEKDGAERGGAEGEGGSGVDVGSATGVPCHESERQGRAAKASDAVNLTNLAGLPTRPLHKLKHKEGKRHKEIEQQKNAAPDTSSAVAGAIGRRPSGLSVAMPTSPSCVTISPGRSESRIFTLSVCLSLPFPCAGPSLS